MKQVHPGSEETQQELNYKIRAFEGFGHYLCCVRVKRRRIRSNQATAQEKERFTQSV